MRTRRGRAGCRVLSKRLGSQRAVPASSGLPEPPAGSLSLLLLLFLCLPSFLPGPCWCRLGARAGIWRAKKKTQKAEGYRFKKKVFVTACKIYTTSLPCPAAVLGGVLARSSAPWGTVGSHRWVLPPSHHLLSRARGGWTGGLQSGLLQGTKRGGCLGEQQQQHWGGAAGPGPRVRNALTTWRRALNNSHCGKLHSKRGEGGGSREEESSYRRDTMCKTVNQGEGGGCSQLVSAPLPARRRSHTRGG